MPYFEYASVVFTNLSVIINEKLERAFRSAVRFILDARRDLDTAPSASSSLFLRSLTFPNS